MSNRAERLTAAEVLQRNARAMFNEAMIQGLGCFKTERNAHDEINVVIIDPKETLSHCKEKPMLVNIKSPHIHAGGTGLTAIAFNEDQRVEDYQEAAKRLGDPGYVVSRYGITPPHREGVLSLHYIGHPNKAGHDDFWRMVERVQAERAEERRKAQEEAERKKRREVYERQKPVLTRTVDRYGNTSYHLTNLTDAHMQALREVLARVGGPAGGHYAKAEDVNRVIREAGFSYSDALRGQHLLFRS